MTAWFADDGHGAWHFLIFQWNWHQIPDAIKMAKQIGCDIEFKFNNRSWGLISDEDKREALKLLEEHYEVQD